MSPFAWIITLLYPLALCLLALRQAIAVEAKSIENITSSDLRSRKLFDDSIARIKELQTEIEQQDLLIMALWHRNYGVMPEDEKGWSLPKSRFGLSPKWKVHKTLKWMTRHERYSWKPEPHRHTDWDNPDRDEYEAWY